MKYKIDLTTENNLKILITDLKDRFLEPVKATVLYTGKNLGKTVSIQFDNIQITFDYNELKKIVGE